MAEFFTPAQLQALSKSVVRCDFLVDFDFLSGRKSAWNGNTELTVAGNTYQPMFGFGQIEGLGFGGAGTTSDAVTLTLNGLPEGRAEFLSAALSDTENVQQQLLTISLQLFDEDWQTVGSPIALFRGFMQPPKVTRTTMEGESGATQTITLVAENIFFGRARPPNGRYTDRDQQARSPGDKFFAFVSSLVYRTYRYPDY